MATGTSKRVKNTEAAVIDGPENSVISKIASDEKREDETFSLRPLQHPLLNPVVLDNLFQYCTNGSLVDCRLVCDMWSRVCTKILRRRNCVVEFYTAKDFEVFTSTAKASSIRPYPFRSFTFHWETFRTVHNPVLRNCFDICKDFVEELSLPLDYEYQEVEDKLTVIPSITLPLMEKLTTFSLDMQHAVPELLEIYVPENDMPRETWSKRYLRPLFQSMPNLRSFALINRIAGHVHEIQPHTKCVTEFITHLLQLKDLEEFKLVALVSDDNLRLMNGLNLKSLKINFYNSQISSETFSEFLNSQKNTLESLEIAESEDFRTNYTVKFPCMPTLKRLSIRMVHSHDNIFFSRTSYAKVFPKLQSFVYSRTGNQLTTDWFIDPCPTLKDAKIYFHILPSLWQIYPMTQNFTALKKLELFCGSYCQNIFQHMNSLEELVLMGCHLSNESVEFLMTGLRFTEDKEELEIPFEGRYRPSVGLLKNLSTLTLVGQTERKSLTTARLDITDFSGYNSFLKMESLKCLQIGPCKITEQCYKDMSKKFLVIPLSKTLFRTI